MKGHACNSCGNDLCCHIPIWLTLSVCPATFLWLTLSGVSCHIPIGSGHPITLHEHWLWESPYLAMIVVVRDWHLGNDSGS